MRVAEFLKKVIKIFKLLLLLWSVFFAIWSSWRIIGIALDRINDGKKNISEGIPFFFAERLNLKIIFPAIKFIPHGVNVYYWTIPQLENEISHECRVYELAYYLFPSNVAYRNQEKLTEADFIICEAGFAGQLSRKILEFKFLKGAADFYLAYQDEGVAIFARDGKSLIPDNSPESGEISRQRLSICKVMPQHFVRAAIGILFLFLIGCLTLKVFFTEIFNIFNSWRILPISFVFGSGVLGFTLFYLSLCGMIFDFYSLVISSVSMFLFLSFLAFLKNKTTEIRHYFRLLNFCKKIFSPDRFNYPFFYRKFLEHLKLKFLLLLLIFSFLALSFLFLTFSYGASDAAGQAVWGMKSRMIINSGLSDFSFLKDTTRLYSHPDYPPLWSLLLAWVSVISCGAYNEITIKLLSAASIFMLWLSFFVLFDYYKIESWLLYALLFTLGGNFYLLTAASSYYAEPFLMLFIFWGLFMIIEYCSLKFNNSIYLYSGFFLISAGAMIKNEGIAIYSIIALAFIIVYGSELLFAKKIAAFTKELLFIIFLPCLGFLLWKGIIVYHEIPSYDYDFSFRRIFQPEFSDQIIQAIKAALYSIFIDVKANGGFWYIFLFIALLNWKKSLSQKSGIFILIILLAYFFVLMLVFGFSVRRIDWHLRVMPRITILLQIIAISYLTQCLSSKSIMRI